MITVTINEKSYLQHLFFQRKLHRKVIQVRAISLARDWNDSQTYRVMDYNQQLLLSNFHLTYINH